MTRFGIPPFKRTAWNKCMLVLAFALGACTVAPEFAGFGLLSSDHDDNGPVSAYSRGRLDQLWTAAPDALVMVQRGAQGEYIQMIGLENETTLKGDNFLWLRAQSKRSVRFDLDELVADVGGVPYPFTSIDNNDLRSGADGMGSYVWKEWSSGSQTNCVVAVRSLDSGARNLPGSARSLDVFLRNCVVGSTEEALQPIMDNRISHSARNAVTSPGGATRSISPLAGPRQP